MNRDYKERDKLIFGEEIDWPEGGIKKFEEVDIKTLDNLIEKEFLEKDEAQNLSPTTDEFLELMRKHPKIKAHGYAVSPHRDDYRVTLEGVQGKDLDADALEAAIDLCRCANELNFSLKDGTFSAWWD